MRDRPDGAQLLHLARRTLLDTVAPTVPEAERFTVRLVANAMAIAAREMETSKAGLRVQCRALEDLFGELRGTEDEAAAPESLDEVMTRLNWRLAAEVRAGGRDADARVHALLVQDAEARLAIVKPRAVTLDEAETA